MMVIDYEARAQRKHERDVHDAALASIPGREWFGAMKARLKLHFEKGGDGQRHGLVPPTSPKIAQRLKDKRENLRVPRGARKASNAVGSYTQNMSFEERARRWLLNSREVTELGDNLPSIKVTLPDFYLPEEV